MVAVPHIARTLEPFLARVVAQFPPVLLTGPRQSGKTTLLRYVLAGTHADVSLEAPEVRASAMEDPRGFTVTTRPRWCSTISREGGAMRG